MSVITSRDRDCLLCRLVSGCGLIGAGTYVVYKSNSAPANYAKIFMRGFAGVLVVLGTARLLNMGPFVKEDMRDPFAT